MSGPRPHFLRDPVPTPAAEALFAEDLADPGYVMNLSRLWAYQAETQQGLFDLMRAATSAGDLTLRQRGILVTACASALGDSYCSLAWGAKLADEAGAEAAAGVLVGDYSLLTEAERSLARWARQVATDPNSTTEADVDDLRASGFTDEQIFAATVYVAFRLAFSTVNDALGARPDAELMSTAPDEVIGAVDFGRPPAG